MVLFFTAVSAPDSIISLCNSSLLQQITGIGRFPTVKTQRKLISDQEHHLLKSKTRKLLVRLEKSLINLNSPVHVIHKGQSFNSKTRRNWIGVHILISIKQDHELQKHCENHVRLRIMNLIDEQMTTKSIYVQRERESKNLGVRDWDCYGLADTIVYKSKGTKKAMEVNNFERWSVLIS